MSSLREELASAFRSLRKVDVQIIIKERILHKGQLYSETHIVI